MLTRHSDRSNYGAMVSPSRLRSFSGLFFVTLAALGCLLLSSISEAAPLDKPLKDVIDPYLAITNAVAADSFKGVPENAAALNKAVTANPKVYSADVVKQAAALTQAKDVATTRVALKPLSLSLISILAAQKVQTGSLYEGVCPMQGSWIQSDKKVRNPYDSTMTECGDIKRSF